MAKQSGDTWFIGAMNNDVARTISLDTSFLPAGKYELEYWEDTKDAGKNPTKLRKGRITIQAGKPVKIQMANGGGYVAVVKSL
ncbi:glycoside hydrolase family 97 C-terminal domain-containing protein [Bacteroides sp. 519]|uniref:glycoside hydrolase family 97 C-terminal domain-containing protein n=1 Tax=Bacteroides sp. 519 TaxID=2302937 RepID=UPI00351A561B